MAKKQKLDENKFLRKRGYRRSDFRTLRERILIVCEGEKTEPNYFKSIERTLPRGYLKLDIHGIGDYCLNVVDYTITERDKISVESRKCDIIRPFDQSWAVFDKDSFKSDDFDNAIHKADSNKINVAYSVEAFELWYVLHFEYLNSGISRKYYSRKLSKHMGFKYHKNSETMYDTLQKLGDEEFAINNAEKLLNTYDHLSRSCENPSTTVHNLIVTLNGLR